MCGRLIYMTTRSFHIGDILSITTGRLVSPTGMDGVQAVLNFMTSDDLTVTELLEAAPTVRPAIRTQLPWTAEVVTPDEFTDEAHVDAFVAEMAAMFGEQHKLTPVVGGEPR